MENDYLKLLLRYGSLPQPKRKITIFEVSGYPHYENVCSNVLAFYLDPQREHGLGDLLLSCLLRAAGQPFEENSHSVRVEREFSTISGGRLDLLVDSDTYVIGIENKIFHNLHNDLTDYKNTINQRAGDYQIPVRIVLSLNPVEVPEETGFVNITYSNLWQEVKSNIGFYASSAASKWTTYLIDFIETLEQLMGAGMNLTDQDKFFVEHEEIIGKLVNERKLFIDKLNSQVSILRDVLETSGYAPTGFKKRWIYDSSCLAHDYELSGHRIAFDLYISPKGWVLKLFARKQSSNYYLAQLISARRDQVTIEDNRYVIGRWPLSTGLEEIREHLCEWMTWLVQEDASSQV